MLLSLHCCKTSLQTSRLYSFEGRKGTAFLTKQRHKLGGLRKRYPSLPCVTSNTSVNWQIVVPLCILPRTSVASKLGLHSDACVTFGFFFFTNASTSHAKNKTKLLNLCWSLKNAEFFCYNKFCYQKLPDSLLETEEKVIGTTFSTAFLVWLKISSFVMSVPPPRHGSLYSTP